MAIYWAELLRDALQREGVTAKVEEVEQEEDSGYDPACWVREPNGRQICFSIVAYVRDGYQYKSRSFTRRAEFPGEWHWDGWDSERCHATLDDFAIAIKSAGVSP